MKSKSKIIKKNNRQKLGIFNRELVIKFAKTDNKKSKSVMYHIVLTRRRSHAGGRYDKLGYYEIKKEKRRKMSVLGLNKTKIKEAIELGATFHISVFKILLK